MVAEVVAHVHFFHFAVLFLHFCEDLLRRFKSKRVTKRWLIGSRRIRYSTAQMWSKWLSICCFNRAMVTRKCCGINKVIVYSIWAHSGFIFQTPRSCIDFVSGAITETAYFKTNETTQICGFWVSPLQPAGSQSHTKSSNFLDWTPTSPNITKGPSGWFSFFKFTGHL